MTTANNNQSVIAGVDPNDIGENTPSYIQLSEPLAIVKIRHILLHGLALGIFFVPFDSSLLVLLAITFFTRMFGMEAGYHRYFSHRAYKTSRAFQLFMAVLAQTGGMKGVLWWAMHHRHHHRYADTKDDVHSPLFNSFWNAHFSWILEERYLHTDLRKVKDLAKYPELVFLNKFHYLPSLALIGLIYYIGEYTSLMPNVSGWQALVWGFFFSSVLVFHFTLTVNSVVHDKRFKGTRRYDTPDAARNNAWLAIPLMGASWHNNHHYHPHAGRAGFYWWELDLTYYILRILQAFRIIWDLKEVPQRVLDEGRKKKNK